MKRVLFGGIFLLILAANSDVCADNELLRLIGATYAKYAPQAQDGQSQGFNFESQGSSRGIGSGKTRRVRSSRRKDCKPLPANLIALAGAFELAGTVQVGPRVRCLVFCSQGSSSGKSFLYS